MYLGLIFCAECCMWPAECRSLTNNQQDSPCAQTRLSHSMLELREHPILQVDVGDLFQIAPTEPLIGVPAFLSPEPSTPYTPGASHFNRLLNPQS